MKKKNDELKEIRGYDKRNMLYPDRCMMKWQGMLLSDHTEAMKETSEESQSKKDSEETSGKSWEDKSV